MSSVYQTESLRRGPSLRWRRSLLPFAAGVILLVLCTVPSLFSRFLSILFPATQDILYPRSSMVVLLGEHLFMTAVSSAVAVALGVMSGILVTRKSGRIFLPLVEDFSSLMQTFPPVAILALAVPVIGFGFEPAITALILYSVLPVLKNTLSGISSVPSDIREAARGVGMSPLQVLSRIELPLASHVILAGIRISVVINIGTATVGAVVGAGGLGAPIVAGLSRNNTAFIFQGALIAALLAFTMDRLFAFLEEVLFSGEHAESE